MEGMKLSEYLAERRGRVQALAYSLDVSTSLVIQWARGKPVSAERCYPIEQATGGLVRRWDRKRPSLPLNPWLHRSR